MKGSSAFHLLCSFFHWLSKETNTWKSSCSYTFNTEQEKWNTDKESNGLMQIDCSWGTEHFYDLMLISCPKKHDVSYCHLFPHSKFLDCVNFTFFWITSSSEQSLSSLWIITRSRIFFHNLYFSLQKKNKTPLTSLQTI